MINIALTLAYDGSNYFGWQKCRAGNTIEESLTKALEQILQHKVEPQAASRTDRGVHAEGQVVNCKIKECDLIALHKSMNRLLPPSIRVYKIEKKEDAFHATLSATHKCYCYKIYHHPLCPPQLHRTHWHIYQPLTIDLMQEGASYLLGTHDFSAFCNQINGQSEDKIRTLLAIEIIEGRDNELFIEVTGNRFLYKMVRNIVGTLVQVGQGKKKPQDLLSILQGKKRLLGGITAPAYGLTLKEIFYDRS